MCVHVWNVVKVTQKFCMNYLKHLCSILHFYSVGMTHRVCKASKLIRNFYFISKLPPCTSCNYYVSNRI